MNQLGPFAALVGLTAVTLAGLGAGVALWNEEGRRLRRGLRKVLGENPHAIILSPGRGRGAGFNFSSGAMAVAWDGGGWCLVYRIDEFVGIELAVDGQIVARTWRGEVRRPLERLSGAEREVALRLVFDDPHHPDFLLVLWSPEDEARRAGAGAEAMAEGNRWIARTESLFRRKPSAMAPRAAAPPAPAPGPAPPPIEPLTMAAAAAAAASPAAQELPFCDPPWEDDEDDAAAM